MEKMEKEECTDFLKSVDAFANQIKDLMDGTPSEKSLIIIATEHLGKQDGSEDEDTNTAAIIGVRGNGRQLRAGLAQFAENDATRAIFDDVVKLNTVKKLLMNK